MALHFSREELAARRRRVCERMAQEGLDGLLIFKQESMYYLTGFDTSGFSMFQGLYLGVDGRVALCTRSPDLRQARITSVIEDVRVWRDREGANPALDLRSMLADYGCRGKRLGIEYHAYGLSTQRGLAVMAALDGFCTLVDASDLVRVIRLVKSPAELEYVRQSGRLCDAARDVANRRTAPGADLGPIYGEMQSVILAGGGDPSASRWPMGAGTEAFLGRYHTGLGRIGESDQVTYEFAASYRHYHTGLMYVALTGRVDPRHREMFGVCREALRSCEDVLRPGNTVGDIFAAHVRVFTQAGHGDHILNACGYSMGAQYPPTWMDWPMIHEGNPQVLEPNMVFFVIMCVLDDAAGVTQALAETAIVTEGACELVTHAPRELIVR